MEPQHKQIVDNMFKGITLFPQDDGPISLGKSVESFGRKTRDRLAKAGWPSLMKKRTSKRSFRMSKSTSKRSKSRAGSKQNSFRKLNNNWRSQEERSSVQDYNSYLNSVKNSRSAVDLAASDGKWRSPYKGRMSSKKRRRPMSAQIRNMDNKRMVS